MSKQPKSKGKPLSRRTTETRCELCGVTAAEAFERSMGMYCEKSKTGVHSMKRLPRPKLSEADLERQCSDLLAFDGWRSLKTDPVSRREWGKGFGEKGMADRLYVRYALSVPMRPGTYDPASFAAAQVMWIEWKVPRGRNEPHQKQWQTAERLRGALVLVAREDFPATFEGFCAWYAKSGLLRRAGLCST